MNKKLNKLVTNYPVELTEEEIGNLSGTLAPVVAACGGGGGGTGGKIYTGTGFVNVNNTTNQISLTNEANEKLNEDYVTYVEYSTQIAKFYTKNQVNNLLDEKQDTLEFEYDEDNKVSAINGSALAGQGGTTYTPGQYINIDSNNEISVTGLVAIDEYATYSGDWNDVSNSYKTNSGSFITKDVNDLTNYYSKTQTSSDNELSTEFAKYATTTYVDGKDPVLIGDSNITATSSTVDGHTQWNLAINAQPTVTDTTLTGENGIYTHTTTKSGEWCVELVQTAYAAINAVQNKLDTTAAAQTYLEKSTYSNASGKWENASNVVATNSADWNAKVDQADLDYYLTMAQYGTDSATFALKTQLDEYYTKTDTSSKTELSNEFAKYVTSSDITTQDTNYVMTTTGWKVLTLPGGGMTEVTHDTTLTGQGNDVNSKLGVAWSALSGYTIASSNSATWATKAMGNHTEYTLGTTLDTMSNITATIDRTLMSMTGYNGIERQIDDITDYASAFGLTNTAYAAIQYVTANSGDWDKVSDKLDTTAAEQTYQTKGDYVKNTDIGLDANNKVTAISGKELIITAHQSLTNYYTKSETSGATEISTALGNKVDKPSSLVDKYLVLRTDNAGNVSGWCDFQDQSYSKSEANGTFVATANIDTTTLSGDGKSVNTKLGVKTDVIATRDYVNSSFLPTSGGTVSGQLVVSGDGNFDQENLKFIRSGLNGYGRIGLASNGAFAVKVDDSNSNTTQINVAANASYNELIQVQHGGTTAYLIPAVTSTTTAGLTNDGILHIILES